MAVFSSTQPSLRARILPRFPAHVVAGNGVTITKSGLTYTFEFDPDAIFVSGTLTPGRVPFISSTGLLDTSVGISYDTGSNTLTTESLTVSGNISAGGIIISSGPTIQTQPTTVALLPVVGTKGRRAFVTDASATTFASIVAGGGANNVPVYDDGTNWRIG